MLGSDLLNILENVLPAHFGGSPLDYQLIEEEDESGFTRVVLAVSPSVPIADESEVTQTMLRAIRQQGPGAGIVSDMWAQSGNLQIRRMNPILTARGKLLPLYLPGRHGMPAHQDDRA
jgi:hypothetical protein